LRGIWPLGFLKTHLRQKQKNNNLHWYKNFGLVCFTEYRDASNTILRDLVCPLEQELVIERLKGNERVIPIAMDAKLGRMRRCQAGRGWDSCFKFLIKEVMEQYAATNIKKIKVEK
jgi:hypothetical protein